MALFQFNIEPRVHSSVSNPGMVIVKMRTGSARKRMLAHFPVKDNPGIIERLILENKILRSEPLFPEQSTLDRKMFLSKDSLARFPAASKDSKRPSLSGLNILHFNSVSEAANNVAAISSDPMVEYAHLPALRLPTGLPDPHLNRQWGLSVIQYFNALNVPNYVPAEGIRIGVLDTGIDPDHPDLQGVIAENVDFSSKGTHDDTGHGTHVAGIIAAVANNGTGISGISGTTKLFVLRGLTIPYDAIAYYKALRYAIDNKIQVLNCSLGGSHDPTEAEIVREAISQGMIIVAAMGNDYINGNPISYPAALPDIIAVGASSEVDQRASFSQTGPHISLVAPGSNILSTTPTYQVRSNLDMNYGILDGTSMATPFVTAAVALLLAKKPSASRKDIVKALTETADQIDGQMGFTEHLGYGRLNLLASLQAIG